MRLRLNALFLLLLTLGGTPAIAGMTAAGLKSAICAQLPTPADATKQTAFCLALATAIVAYIQANAVVTVATAIPVATTGTAAAQTGATTAPGTGTIQ
jgi:hypothetical protein